MSEVNVCNPYTVRTNLLCFWKSRHQVTYTVACLNACSIVAGLGITMAISAADSLRGLLIELSIHLITLAYLFCMKCF